MAIASQPFGTRSGRCSQAVTAARYPSPVPDFAGAWWAEHTSFDFLGFTFRGRLVRGKYGHFTGFVAAISTKARKAIGQQIRAWHLNRRSWADLSSLARGINPTVRGWANYYGAFYHSELRFLSRENVSSKAVSAERGSTQ
jgi:hypothetical protein